jgi:diguanylate cyclase (GGDEF)-like protein
MLEVIAQQVATSVANAQLYAQMEEMATTDALTGLFNRRVFKERLAEVIARGERGAGASSLLLTDIDHFKRINDTYGHPVGDEVLRRVSATFREVLRQTDIPARYGGEEFVVILEGTALEGAALIAERLRVAVAALRFEAPQGEFQISMSFGVAAWPEDARDGEALIERADQALYFAKKSGRDQVRLWRRLPALVQGGASAA